LHNNHAKKIITLLLIEELIKNAQTEAHLSVGSKNNPQTPPDWFNRLYVELSENFIKRLVDLFKNSSYELTPDKLLSTLNNIIVNKINIYKKWIGNDCVEALLQSRL